MDKELIDYAARALRNAHLVVCLSGAGMSKESGIPTFRDAQTGLWANYNPEELATPQAFKRNPGLVWRWYDWRRQQVGTVDPNPGHYALVELEKHVPELRVVTQNVDGLHERAGSDSVLELHGNISRIKCFDQHHYAQDVPHDLPEPPQCHCGSLLRPDVVWFGEVLEKDILNEAFRLSDECDVMIVIGTSGIVQPAASLPVMAKRKGARLIEVNPDATPLTDIADVYIPGASGQVLPQIVEAVSLLFSET